MGDDGMGGDRTNGLRRYLRVRRVGDSWRLPLQLEKRLQIGRRLPHLIVDRAKDVERHRQLED